MRIPSLILVASLLTLDAAGASRARVASSPPLASAQPSANSLTSSREIAVAPVSQDLGIHQTNPVIASDGESFVLVWRESTDCCFIRMNQQTTGQLYAARLSSRGEMIGTPTLLSSIATTATPGVTFDGTNYLVAWGEFGPLGRRVVAQRFSPDLIPVEATPFIVRNPVPSPDMRIGVACGADDCLVIFDQGHALISKTGGVLTLSLGTGGLKNSVIPTESGYLATMMTHFRWSGPGAPAPPTDENTIAEFSREGTLSEVFDFGYFTAYTDERIDASLATNGSSILIAGVDSNYEHPQLARTPLYVLPVQRLFSVPKLYVDIGTIDGRQPSIHDPGIIWTGTRFLVVYQRTNESFSGPFTRPPTRADIWGVFVEPDGSAVSGPPFELTSTDEFEALPSIAANARGLMALAFVRGRGGEESPNPRLFVKLLSDNERSRRRPARPSGQAVTLSAEKTGASSVTIRLTNNASTPIVHYNLCPVSIDRWMLDRWEDITTRAFICIAVATRLNPGETATVERPITEVTEPGIYRFRTEIATPGRREVVSNSLELP